MKVVPPKNIPFHQSIRTKLVVVSIVVEITMLGLLLSNSMRLLNQTLEEQTQAKLSSISPLLDSALSARLFERDHAGITEILNKLMKSKFSSFQYIVVYDNHGIIYAQSGKINAQQMPALDQNIINTISSGVYNSHTQLTLGNEQVGEVRFGLSLQSLINSRDNLIQQGFIIASVEVLLTFILLSIGGFLLTRHILTLMSATQQVAAGNHDIQIPISSRDEIGMLASNFNLMARAIHDRIDALHVSEQALFVEKERAEITLHSIGDGVITTDTMGNVASMNPVAEQLTGWLLSEAQSRPLADIYRIIDTRSQQPTANLVQYVLEHGDIVGLTEHASLISRSGDVSQVADNAALLMNKAGKVSGVVLVFHNVTEQYRQQALIIAHEAELRKITDILPGPVTHVDRNGSYLFASAAFKQWYGKHASEVIGHNWRELIDTNLQAQLQPYLERALAGENGSVEIKLPIPSGGTRDAIINVLPDFDNNGEVCGYYTIGVDISELRHAEASLVRFRAALDSSVDAIYLIDRKAMRFIDANRTGWESVGLTRDELLKIGPQDLNHEIPSDALVAEFDKILASPAGHGVIRTTQRRKDNSSFPVEVLVQRLVEEGSSQEGQLILVALARDISERISSEKTLHHLAYYDSLTGLPNRLLFNDRLRQAVEESKRRGNFIALMLLDIDRFKNVNDTLGHEAGDKLLREISSRLQVGMRKSDTIARLGGDEFTVIFPDLSDVQDVVRMAQNILIRLALPLIIDGHEIFPSASIGITLYPHDTTDEDALVKFADSAMYHAKAQGRNNYQFYSREMTTHIQERMALETDMRKALERGEFFLNYQPQVDIATGRITGMETLIRWRNSLGKNISPAEFIPLAEETGLIVPIGEWVLETACMQLKAWNNAGYTDLLLAVNVASRQFHDPHFRQAVSQIISTSGISPQSLELEITEGILLQYNEEIRNTFIGFKDAGMKLAIDDFGTGYSSLSYLKRFPIDRLKIDQSFVRDISTDTDDLAIVKAIIALAHALKLDVIAEGVETETQLNLLRSEGCKEYQGYFFARPMDADAFTALLQSSNFPK
jgi:diguanylate cyclase (GGDEF)-like protein/PAS domain S-box-containing protein